MAPHVVDPRMLIGDRLLGVTVAWPIPGDRGRPVAYFLRFASGVEVRASLNEGTIELVAGSPRSSSDTAESGTVELEPVETTSAIAPFVDRTIVGVDRVWWLGGGGTGLRLRVDSESIVITPDEVHGHQCVTILDGDIDESWGHEPVA